MTLFVFGKVGFNFPGVESHRQGRGPGSCTMTGMTSKSTGLHLLCAAKPLPGRRNHVWGMIGPATAALALLAMAPAMAARTPWPDSPLTPEVQVQLEKAGRFMTSGKPQKAQPIIASALPPAIASFTETYGFPLMETRRQCVQKALTLCQNREDYLLVALKARHFEFYEITRECVNHLLQDAKTVPDLFDLARKAQEVSLNDVAHMALDKAYTGIKSVPEAVQFAHDVKQMGMDDLVRKVVRDLIDDEENAQQLCNLLRSTEDLGMEDLNRYCLKKALDKAQTVDELKCIYEGARRNRQNDILQVALYRGKKLTLIQKIQRDQAEYQRQLQQWQSGAQEDLAKQQEEAERNMGLGPGKHFGTDGSNEPQSSGF